MTEGRLIWAAPKFKIGDLVRFRDWPMWRLEKVTDPDIEDGLGRYVRTDGGGTYGEGAMTKVEENKP